MAHASGSSLLLPLKWFPVAVRVLTDTWQTLVRQADTPGWMRGAGHASSLHTGF